MKAAVLACTAVHQTEGLTMNSLSGAGFRLIIKRLEQQRGVASPRSRLDYQRGGHRHRHWRGRAAPEEQSYEEDW